MKDNRNDIPMLIVLITGSFIASFNENIINVGLTDIMSEFQVSSLDAQWLVTGYMIVTCVLATCMAFLLKRTHLKVLICSAAAILIAGSAVSFFATSFSVLLVSRLFAAIGTGIFIPAMMTSILALAPRGRLGTFLAIGGACITLGPAVAPVLSGLMVQLMGWRGVFIIPMGIVALIFIAALPLVHDIAPVERIRLDTPSLALSAAGLTAFVYGISELSTATAVGIVALIAGLAIIAAFCRRQSRIDTPLLNLEPMRDRRFSTACILVIVAMMTTFSMSVLLPLYYEGACGTDAFMAGLLILIPVLFNAVTALAGGRIFDRLGEWPLLPIGFALIVIGQLSIAFVSSDATINRVLIASTVVYAGVGLIFSPSQTAGLKGLSPKLHAHGVMIMNTFVMIAACIGPALFIGVLSSREGAVLASGMSASSALAQGFGSAVLVAAIIAAIGFALATVYAIRAHRRQAASQGKASLDESSTVVRSERI